VTALSAQSLVVHHLAHWLMVGAGALAGYQLRSRWQPPARASVACVAWLGLGTALLWHLPPALALTQAGFAVHALVHASLLAGGAAMGWALPGLGGSGRAALFIAANVVMWPVALADLGGAFSYPGYPGQASAAGVSELAAMPLAWLVLALWGPLCAALSRPVVALTLQGAMVGLVLLFWTAV
jgi:hypothetical protein